MAGAQCDIARSFGSLLGSFGAFGLEPRRVGSPTRHGGGPIRRGALFRLTFGLFCHLGGGATSCWRSNATWRAPNTTWRTLLTRFLGDLVPLGWSHVALEGQRDMAGPNATWRALFAPFWAVLDPLGRSHVVLEAQRDMAGTQCDVACSSCSLLGCFGIFELEPRRVGGPTRHGGGPMRRGALFLLPFGLFWTLWDGATSRWRPNATWQGPNTTWPSSNAAWQGAIQCDAPFSRPSNAKKPPPN